MAASLSTLITRMTPRYGRQIGWVHLKAALLLLQTSTATVDNKTRTGSVELNAANDYEYDVEFDTAMDDASYIVPNKWAERPSGDAIKVVISNKTKDGFKVNSRKECTYEFVAYKL